LVAGGFRHISQCSWWWWWWRRRRSRWW